MGRGARPRRVSTADNAPAAPGPYYGDGAGEVAQPAGPGADVSRCASPQLKRGQAGHNEKCSAPERFVTVID